jgi:hypothetical protein
MSQVYPQDRGQSYSIALANRLDRHLAERGGRMALMWRPASMSE